MENNKHKIESYWTERPDGTVATIHHTQFAAIRFDGVKLVENKKEYTSTPYAPSNLEKIIDGKATVLGKCSIAQWREWAGPVFTPKEVEEDCDECMNGKVECDLGHLHDCDECDGTGKVMVMEDFPERPEIKIGDAYLDSSILAPVLALVNDEEATIGITDKTIVFIGDGWKMVAMRLRHSEDSVNRIIEFNPH